MRAFDTFTGVAIPLGLKNIDTDIILPAQYLKTITRAGLGCGALSYLREDPASVLNEERYKEAPILIAGENFGCGSSREHAPWALADLGIRIIIAPSFADIFAGNAFKNGILLVTLLQAQIDHLLIAAANGEITVDLKRQVVTTCSEDQFYFEIDPFRKHCLMNGLDETRLIEQYSREIAAYEAEMKAKKPWIGATE